MSTRFFEALVEARSHILGLGFAGDARDFHGAAFNATYAHVPAEIFEVVKEVVLCVKNRV